MGVLLLPVIRLPALSPKSVLEDPGVVGICAPTITFFFLESVAVVLVNPLPEFVICMFRSYSDVIPEADGTLIFHIF